MLFSVSHHRHSVKRNWNDDHAKYFYLKTIPVINRNQAMNHWSLLYTYMGECKYYSAKKYTYNEQILFSKGEWELMIFKKKKGQMRAHLTTCNNRGSNNKRNFYYWTKAFLQAIAEAETTAQATSNSPDGRTTLRCSCSSPQD